MGVKKYNLDLIVSRAIHRPIIKGKDLPPLYSRSSTDTANEGENKSSLSAMKDVDWFNASNIKYNSPTNIRRLFIGDTSATIQYYLPPAGDNTCWKTYNLGEDLFELSRRAHPNFRQQLIQSASMAGQPIPDDILLNHTGFGALSSDWKVSNIEELYITPAILVSLDLLGKLGPIANQILGLYFSRQSGGYLESDIPKQILSSVINADIQSKYPRLRTIALVSKLDSLIEKTDKRKLGNSLPGSASEINLSWYQFMRGEFSNNSPNILVLSKIPHSSLSDILSFSIRPGIYRYDAEYLVPFVERYKHQVNELARSNTAQAQTQTQPQHQQTQASTPTGQTRSEYEEYLDNELKTHGAAIVSMALRLVFCRSNQQEIQSVFNEMTASGREKYLKLLGR